MRAARKWIFRAGLAVVIMAGAVFALLLTGPGQRLALQAVSYAASDKAGGISVGRLEGSLLSSGKLDSIVLRDSAGIWLEVRDVDFSWQPLSLLSGLLDIDHVAARSISVLRQPVSETNQKSGRSKGMSLPGWAVLAQRIEVGELNLGQLVAGEAARLQITGSADIVDPKRGLSAALKVSRLDAPGGAFAANFSYVPEGGLLDVTASVSEPAKGLIARLIDMPGLPPLAMTFTGAGPIDKWRARWSLEASSEPFAAGTASIDKEDGRHRIGLAFEGFLETIVPRTLSGLLAGKMVASLSGHFTGGDTGLEIFQADHLSVASDAMKLTASGGFDAARVNLFGTLSARLGRQDGASVGFTRIDGSHIAVEAAAIYMVLPQGEAARRVTANLSANGLSGDFGTVSDVVIAAAAVQDAPFGDNAFSSRDIVITANATGLAPRETRLAAALGSEVSFRLTGQGSHEALKVSEFRIATSAAELSGKGELKNRSIAATADLDVGDLSRLSGLAGRPVGGKLRAQLSGQAETDGSNIKVGFDANAEGLRAGHAIADRLLAGATRLTGTVTAAANGALAVENLKLSNNALDATLDGRLGDKPVNLTAHADIRDLGSIDGALKGSARLRVQLDGHRGDFASQATISGENVVLNGEVLEAPSLSLTGRGSLDAHNGKLELSGRLNKQPVNGTSRLAYSTADGISVDDFKLTLASLKADGSVRIPVSGAAVGKFTIDAPRLADLAAFVGQPLEGSAKAAITLGGNAEPDIAFEATAPSIRVGDSRLKTLRAHGVIRDLTAALRVDASIHVAAIDHGAVHLRDVRADARDAGGATDLKVAAVANDHQINASGNLARHNGDYAIKLAGAVVDGPKLSARLAAPATVNIAGGSAKFDGLSILAGGGRADVTGTVGAQAISLAVTMTAVPASLANAFADDLGLEGRIDGRIAVRGSIGNPAGDVTLAWRGAASSAMRAQDLPPLSLDASGTLDNGVFDGQIKAGGVPGLAVTAKGSLGTNTGGDVQLRIAGDIPISLANGALASRATRVAGTARLEADVSGKLAQPIVEGALRLADGTLNDAGSGLKLTGMAGSARFTSSSLVIERIVASSTKGGALTAQGSLSRASNGTGPLLAGLVVDLAAMKFDDRELMSGEVDGRITLSGPLEALSATGNIDLKRLNVIVPDQLPRSIAQLELRHVNAPEFQRKAFARQNRNERPDSQKSTVRLDIGLTAANRIFVRGRGLDAQLGGDLRIRGSAQNPIADGAFEMERGRLAILGRNLDFRRGNLLFNGSTEPLLDMEATTAADSTTIAVFVTGPASQPAFRFSSAPELPEDEVVARLLFNKALAKLSPIQLAQLAAEVDKIGGLSSGPGLLDQLKGTLGVDVLDVTTDKSGATAVSAGSYLNEQTYVGVSQGAKAGSSQIVIDHDLTKNIKARGEVGADGNSKVGIGVEWDY